MFSCKKTAQWNWELLTLYWLDIRKSPRWLFRSVHPIQICTYKLSSYIGYFSSTLSSTRKSSTCFHIFLCTNEFWKKKMAHVNIPRFRTPIGVNKRSFSNGDLIFFFTIKIHKNHICTTCTFPRLKCFVPFRIYRDFPLKGFPWFLPKLLEGFLLNFFHKFHSKSFPRMLIESS